MLLCAAGEDGRDAGDAQLGGLFDGPLEVVELEDSEQEVDGEGCAGFEFLVEDEADFVFRDRSDFGTVEEAIGYDVEELAGLRAQDACEMFGLLAGEGGVRGMAGLRRPESVIQRRLIRQGTGNREQRTVRFGQRQWLNGGVWVLAFCSLFTVPCSLIFWVGDGDSGSG